MVLENLKSFKELPTETVTLKPEKGVVAIEDQSLAPKSANFVTIQSVRGPVDLMVANYSGGELKIKTGAYIDKDIRSFEEVPRMEPQREPLDEKQLVFGYWSITIGRPSQRPWMSWVAPL